MRRGQQYRARGGGRSQSGLPRHGVRGASEGARPGLGAASNNVPWRWVPSWAPVRPCSPTHCPKWAVGAGPGAATVRVARHGWDGRGGRLGACRPSTPMPTTPCSDRARIPGRAAPLALSAGRPAPGLPAPRGKRACVSSSDDSSTLWVTGRGGSGATGTAAAQA